MEKANKLISRQLTEFEAYFREAVKSKVPLLDRIMSYIVKRKGKAITPHVCVAECKAIGWRN